MLDHAARCARTTLGFVEPNPAVGCVIARGDEIIAEGWHQRFGQLHAEREALADCHRRGNDPRGATMYVTLEPCSHTGKQPPCSEAVIEAGVAELVIARPDPGPLSGGGGAVVEAAGIAVRYTDASQAAIDLSDPFVKGVKTGLPWVIAKWAQTVDGRIATRTGASQWISNERSRESVQQTRGRVDAILTGSGTALADDPRLTVRSDGAARRIPRRVLLDSNHRVPRDSALVRTLDDASLTIASATPPDSPIPGVEHWNCPGADGRVDLPAVLKRLAEQYDAANVLLEAGPTLLGGFLAQGLIDECHVYIAPILFADDQARPAVSGCVTNTIVDGHRFRMTETEHLDGDVLIKYRRDQASDGTPSPS